MQKTHVCTTFRSKEGLGVPFSALHWISYKQLSYSYIGLHTWKEILDTFSVSIDLGASVCGRSYIIVWNTLLNMLSEVGISENVSRNSSMYSIVPCNTEHYLYCTPSCFYSFLQCIETHTLVHICIWSGVSEWVGVIQQVYSMKSSPLCFCCMGLCLTHDLLWPIPISCSHRSPVTLLC